MFFEGYNITSGREFADALTQNEGSENCTTFLATPFFADKERGEGESSDEEEESDSESSGPVIKKGSELHLFKFVPDGVHMKKHGLVGEGKFQPLKSLPIPQNFQFEMVPVQQIQQPLDVHKRFSGIPTDNSNAMPGKKKLIRMFEDGAEEIVPIDKADEEASQNCIFPCPGAIAQHPLQHTTS